MDAHLRKRRGILRVSASRHIDCSVRRRPFGPTPFYAALANSFLAASALQMRPPSGWVCRTSSSRTPCGIGNTRPPRSRCAEQCVPSSPYPSTSGGKSLILKRVAENRAPYSRFRFQDVSKTATHSEMFEKPPLISINRRNHRRRWWKRSGYGTRKAANRRQCRHHSRKASERPGRIRHPTRALFFSFYKM